MKELIVPVYINNEWRQQLEYVYTIDELPYMELIYFHKTSREQSHQKDPSTGQYYSIEYLEISCAFDIETTNIYARNGNGQIDNTQRPFAYMYHWQMCIDKYVVFGRTWEEWTAAIRRISNELHLNYKRRLVVYVHNLPFEFQFCRRFLTVTEGFYKEPYKPLRVCCSEGIEFRCSYALSNMSLAQLCKNSRGCIHRKADGDLDYDVRRTAATLLSRKELGYCYNDVAGLAECIRDKMQDDTLASMPMTSTGYVRRECRNRMIHGDNKQHNRNNRKMFEETALNVELYNMFKEAFRGGNTHANAAFANKMITGKISSYDITSSYPAVMMEEYFPMRAFSPYSWEKQEELDPEMDKYCYIFMLLLENPEYIGSCGVPYISEAKCSHITRGDDYQEDNGRIRKAAYLEMTITEIDWKIIKRTYRMDHYYIKDMYAAPRGELPAEFKETVMHYFRQKTTLKGLKDHDSEYLYNKYKNLLNSLFGMTTTRLDMDLILYTPGEENEYQPEGKALLELLTKFYASRNSFLPYQWGVYNRPCPEPP